MNVARNFYEGVDWTIWLIGWLLCLPLRIVYLLLRNITPKLVSSFQPPKKKPKPVGPSPFQQKERQSLELAVKDTNVAAKRFVKEKTRVAPLESQCKALEEENAIKTQRITQLEKSLRKDVKDKDVPIKDIQNEKDEITEEVKSLRKKESESKRQIEGLKKERDDKENKLRQSENQIIKLKESLSKKDSESKKQIEALRRERDDKQNQLRQSEGQITESLPRKDSESRKEIETLTKERDDKQNQLSQSVDQIAKLKESLNKKESDFRKQTEALRKESDDIRNQLKESKDQITKLKESFKNQIASLQEELEKHDAVMQENRQLMVALNEKEMLLRVAEDAKEDALRRLSQRDNNPNSVDLSDVYRPSKLAEMMSELYDNQWTDAFTYLEDNWGHGKTFSETKCIEFLLNVLMEIYTFCLSKITNDWTDGLSKILLTRGPNNETEMIWALQDIRKKNILTQLPTYEKATSSPELYGDILCILFAQHICEGLLNGNSPHTAIEIGKEDGALVFIWDLCCTEHQFNNKRSLVPPCQYIHSLPRKDSKSRKQIEVLTKERDDKQNQLMQSEDQMTKLKESLHRKESESRKQIETLRKERDDKQNQLRQSEIQITKLKESLCQQIKTKDDSIKSLQEDRDHVADVLKAAQEEVAGLSQSVSLRLRDNNPNIVDLSDMYRPSKLAEMMSELYDNQWTDAFTYLEDNWGHGNTFSETECIEFLLNVLMEINTFCLSKITNGWTDGLEKILLTAKPNDEAEMVKMLKDIRKKIVLSQIPNVEKMCVSVLHNTELAEGSLFSKHLLQDKLYEYLQECVKLCLLMAVQDPPVCLVCEGWKTRQTIKGENPCPPADSTSDIIKNGTVEKRKEFDRGSYKEYTKRGKFIEFTVWPLIYLHDNGPILSKGVSQRCDTSTIPPHDDL